LSQQVADLIDEVKSLKNEQRRLMSECDTLLKEKQVLLGENETLLEKLQALDGEVRQVRHEVALHSQQSIRLHSDTALPSRVNNLQTVRTYQASTINNSPRPLPSRHSIDL
jgi:predicted nuclease with TOPRIM domain